MSQIDLQPALRDWKHDPDQISVRKIICGDDRVRIQMRVELGILQMETAGRPDGLEPHGHESLLAYHQERLARHEAINGTTLGFCLSPDECRALRVEASQYYRRYVAYFVLDEYENVLRDTEHSRAIFEMCRLYAFEKEDRDCAGSFLPAVLMMNARARAYMAQRDGEIATAIAHANRGILEIRAHFREIGQTESAPNCEEISVLKDLVRTLIRELPIDSAILTQQALNRAVEAGRYEEAARLRDELRNRYDRSA